MLCTESSKLDDEKQLNMLVCAVLFEQSISDVPRGSKGEHIVSSIRYEARSKAPAGVTL
jgi:hypothetical protein